MRASPNVDLVLGDSGERAGLVCLNVVVRHVQECYIIVSIMSILLQFRQLILTTVIETVDPILRVRLSAVNRANVVGLREVVPGGDFDKVEEIAVSDDLLPAGVVEVRV